MAKTNILDIDGLRYFKEKLLEIFILKNDVITDEEIDEICNDSTIEEGELQ